MRLLYRKVLRDLWNNKGRTLLVVFSIAVGVTAVGMITSSNKLLDRQMIISQKASHPSHAKLYLNGSIDAATVRSLARLPEIDQIEGSIEASIRWKPTLGAEWEQKNAILIALDDYKDQLYDTLELRSGKWPDSKTVVVEYNHLDPFGVPSIGNEVYLEVNEKAKSLIVGGTLRDPSQFPPPNAQGPAFYVTPDVMERLTGLNDFNKIRFTIPEYSEDQANFAADAVETKLKKLGVSVSYLEIQDPERHPLQDIISGVSMVLAVMAFMSLVLSTFLVINTVNAIIAQQVPQIGVMKTIGGVRRQIVMVYLTGVGIYGVLCLVIAVPLGAIGGQVLSQYILFMLNVPTAPFEILGGSLFAQIGAGLIVPLLAGLWPVLGGAGITVMEAISSYGLGTGHYGAGLIDRVLGRIRGLPRLVTLPIRNTFRRIGRVTLTELTLIGAGAIFLTVLSTGNSFTNTIAEALRSAGFDVSITFKNPQLIREVTPMIESRPNVELAEMWVFRSANARVPGATGPGSEYEIALRGVPRDTELYKPQLTAGRNLDPGDGHALLLNQKLAQDMALGVNDRIVLDLGEAGESVWTIVGLIFDLTGGQTTAYMHRDTLNAELHQVGMASVAEIKTSGSEESLEAHMEIIDDMKDFFSSLRIDLFGGSSAIQERQAASAQLSILTTVLLVMTVLVAIVGGIGLSGTLSINVIERRREIGVLRAVGASSGDISLIFMGEGIILGLLSWALAIPISLFAAKFFVAALGRLVDLPVLYFYSIKGVWIWLAIVVVLSLVASWLPAWRATKISVAESLAYE